MKIDENMLCPVCKAKLFTDEVAFCPECGAPHHKQCYLKLGHCAYEEFHGTENQWQPPQEQPEEEQQVVEQTQQAPAPQPVVVEQQNTQQNPFFVANGIDKDEDIGGVKAEDIAKFVGYNALRYIKVFRKFATRKTKVNWNWLAFFLPEFWLVSRKCYPQAILTAFYTVLHSFIYTKATENAEFMAALQSGVVTENVWGICKILLLTSVISLLINLFFGLFGDYIYKKRVYSTIEQMKQEGKVSEMDFVQKGGANLMLPLLMYFAINVLTFIISGLF